MNPLEANLQMAKMRRHKTDVSDAHKLAKTHFKMERDAKYIQDDYYEQMRALTRYYDEVDEEMILLKPLLQPILQKYFIIMSFPLSVIFFYLCPSLWILYQYKYVLL